jgi:hypothetical protein
MGVGSPNLPTDTLVMAIWRRGRPDTTKKPKFEFLYADLPVGNL